MANDARRSWTTCSTSSSLARARAGAAMFGGHGLYARGVMFGLLDDDELFLKTDALTRARFVDAGCRPWVYTRRDGTETDELLPASRRRARGPGGDAPLGAARPRRGAPREGGEGREGRAKAARAKARAEGSRTRKRAGATRERSARPAR